MIDKQKLSKMKVARHLLPPPGPEVVGECIEMIDSLTQENKCLSNALESRDVSLQIKDKKIKELNDVNKNNWLQHEEDLKNKNEEIEELTINHNGMKDKLNRSVELNLTLQGELQKAEEDILYYQQRDAGASL